MDAMGMFKLIIIAQLCFGLFITLLAHYMPPDALYYTESFSNRTNDLGFTNISGEIQQSVTSQLNVPVADYGALVFYSGNIIVDLLLNSAYAVPEMIGLFIYGVTLIFNIDTFAVVLVEIFAAILITALYMMGLLQLLSRIRSGSGFI